VTGDIEGTIVLPDETWSMIAEREPNDTLAQAQVLPPLEPRSFVTVAGEAGVAGLRLGRVDVTDAFRIRCHVAQVVTLTLTASTDGLVVGNFDLAAFNTATTASLGASATPSNPEVVTFTLPAETAADVLVTCASGDGAYTLRFATADVPPVPASIADRGAPVAAARADAASLPSLEAVEYLMDQPACAPSRLLVRPKGPVTAERLAARVGATVVRRTGGGSYVLELPRGLRGAEAQQALAAASRLLGDGDVESAEPDWMVFPTGRPNDPDFQRQWNLEAIGCPSAWDITTGSPSIVIGVLDTGIAAHPDLDTQRVAGFDFVSDAANAGDGDGRDADPTDPGSGQNVDGTSEFHGTHVAGIVAARRNDGYGLSGVAPGCRIMPLRASGKTGGTVSDLADAIRYAAGLSVPGPATPLAAPLRIVNISLATTIDTTELSSACQAAFDAGVLVVCASGNSAGPVSYPAAYPTAFAVGAVDGRLVRASYSNSGPSLDCVAPGGNDDRDVDGDGFLDDVLSTIRDDRRLPSTPGEIYYGGTSMASPHVAGVAGLVLSVNPALTLAQLKATLLASCRDLDVAGVDDLTGAGLIQAGEAVRQALADLGTPRTDPALLQLSSTTIRIPSGQTVGSVYVNNAGGGTLTVTSVVGSTDNGLPWLTGARTSSASASTNTALVLAIVDRTGLSNGFYSGSLLVKNGTTPLGLLRVVLEVGAAPLDGIAFSVVAIDNASNGVVKSSLALPETGYRFTLRGIAPGTYRIRAGTDLDRDGFFCEAPDWCGDYGGAVPGTVTVTSGQVTTGADVELK
jgi:serine protease